jgi:hypothetical protein
MRISRSIVAVATFAAALALAAPATAGQRSIEEFVAAQGTYCIDDDGGGCLLFVPPVANFIGWTVSGETTLASVDYAGLANRPFDCGDGVLGEDNPFGTTTDGMVLERVLDDGRAEITVVLHTRNALTWVADTDFASGPLLFGHRVCDVLGGADAALGDSQLQAVFYNPSAGAPLPDLIELLFARFEDVVSLSFRSHADGSLRAAFGVEDGTPGRATVVETGTLFRTNFVGATEDGFPAERIILRVTGN